MTRSQCIEEAAQALAAAWRRLDESPQETTKPPANRGLRQPDLLAGGRAS